MKTDLIFRQFYAGPKVQVVYCAMETMFQYRELKPSSIFGIDIGAEICFSETKTFFFNFFQFSPTSLWSISICKLENAYWILPLKSVTVSA